MSTQLLNAVMQRHDLSSMDIANRYQVSRRTVFYWLAGKKIPHAVVLLLQQELERPNGKR